MYLCIYTMYNKCGHIYAQQIVKKFYTKQLLQRQRSDLRSLYLIQLLQLSCQKSNDLNVREISRHTKLNVGKGKCPFFNFLPILSL